MKISAPIKESFQAFQHNTAQQFKKVPVFLANVDKRLGATLGIVASIEDSIAGICTSVALKIAEFVKKSMRPLLSYLFAWGVIISFTGLMYGFEAVALPLTIGLGCGIGFGIITAILAKKGIGLNGTPWNFLNRMIEGLDTNGTRQIVLSVAVTVVLAASVVFPYVMGALFGVFIGYQVAAKIIDGKSLGPDPESQKAEKEDLKNKIDKMQQEVIQLTHWIQQIEDLGDKHLLENKLSAMMKQLRGYHSDLNRLYTNPKEEIRAALQNQGA